MSVSGHPAAVSRQPIVHHDGTIYGYALRPQFDTGTASSYRGTDWAGLAGQSPLFVRATSAMLTGGEPVPDVPGGVVLEIGAEHAVMAGIGEHLRRLRAGGTSLALADFSGTSAQDGLLPLVRYVKVDLATDTPFLRALTARGKASGRLVIAERATTRERVAQAFAIGADLVQGPLFSREEPTQPRQFTPGQLQCLELMQLLSSEQIDHAKIVRIVAADPELSVRVLHLVNSSAFGLSRHIDSVHQAVVLVGPQHLAALSTASLIGAEPTKVGPLWATLTRARAVHALAKSEAGYTVGLLSAVAAQQQVPISQLVARAGVSTEVGQALSNLDGPYGPALAAVLAYEDNDPEALKASGLPADEVARTFIAAVPEALAIATALAVLPGT